MGIFSIEGAVHGALVVVNGLDVALVIKLVVKLGVRHMVGLIVIVTRCLVMMSVVSLRVDWTVMGIGVAHRVDVVWIHRVVVV